MSSLEAASMPPFPRRSRLLYGCLIGLIFAAGLASRSPLAEHLPDFVASYAGDTLWALMVFLVLAFVSPGMAPGKVAVSALGLTIFGKGARAPLRADVRREGSDTPLRGLRTARAFVRLAEV